MLKFFKKLSTDTRHFPTGIKLVAFVIFMRTFGWGFIDPFYSIFVDSFGESYKSVGSLVGLMNFIALLTVLPLLKLADKVKDTRIMRDGEVFYLFTIFFYIIAALTQNIWMLIIGLIFNGIGTSLIMVGAESYIRRRSGNSDKPFAFFTALQYLGWVLGMVVGAFTVQYYGLNYMFLFLLPSIFFGMLILNRIKERGIGSTLLGLKKYFHKPKDFEFIIEDLKSLNSKTFYFLLLAFFDGIIVMFSYIFIPLFALSINLNFKQIALLMAVMYVPFIFSFLISEVTDKLKRMNVIAIGLLIGGLAFTFLFFIFGELWVIILAAMTSLSLAIIRPTYNGMLTHLTPRKMLGEITGLNNISMRIGYIVGPVFSGILADSYGLRMAFVVIAVLAFALAITSLIFRNFETIETNA